MTDNNNAIIRAGDMKLDYEHGIVEYGGTVTSLTPIETRLLQTLMQNTGRVVSRRELIRVVWDDQQPDDDRNRLDVYVHFLRRKIESDPQSPTLIITRRGLGYELHL